VFVRIRGLPSCFEYEGVVVLRLEVLLEPSRVTLAYFNERGRGSTDCVIDFKG
jgi:hypothetical protein